ncbi:hypothetical protein SESBI_27851 [Sesbania bispinosa]|nr:hypothetical protein SESBI_27851 [Sesbania bispinosa]
MENGCWCLAQKEVLNPGAKGKFRKIVEILLLALSSRKKRHSIEPPATPLHINIVQDKTFKPIMGGPKSIMPPSGTVANSSLKGVQEKNHGIKTVMQVEVLSSNRLRFIDKEDNLEPIAGTKDRSNQHIGLGSPLDQQMLVEENENMLDMLDQAIGIQPPP